MNSTMEVAKSQDDIIRAAEMGQKMVVGNSVQCVRVGSADFSGLIPDVLVNFFQILKTAPRLEKLDLINVDFVNGWIEHVIEVLISCPTLTDLSLQSNNWGTDFELFCNAIKTNKINLKKLELKRMVSNGLPILFDALKFNTTLESLSIQVQKTDPTKDDKIVPAMKFEELGSKLIVSKNLKRFEIQVDSEYLQFISEGLQQNSTLEELVFKNMKFGDNGLNLIAKILASDQSRLKSLQLISSEIGNDSHEFCEAIKKNATIEKLNLARSVMCADEMIYHPFITHRRMSAPQIHEVLAAISENTTIQEFNWQHNGRTVTQQMIDLIQKRKFSHLTLDLTNGDLATIKVPMIIEALKYDRLVSLEISGLMFMRPESAPALSSYIAETNTLKKLVAKDQSNSLILQGLIKNTSITDLNIAGMVFFRVDSEWERLCELISTNKTITKLNMQNLPSKFDMVHFDNLFKAIKINQTITDLNCSNMEFTNPDCKALFAIVCHTLKVNDTLLYLDLQYIRAPGLFHFAKFSEEQVPLFLEKYRELFSINKSIRRLEFAQFERYTSLAEHPSMPEVRRLWNQNLSHQSEIKINTIVLAKNIVRQISESIFPLEIWLQIFRHLSYKSVPELDPIISQIFS